uniref:Aldehyde dehydrogenase domain-containing protein n=1 Tax=Panagrolaimus sp. JU765 TaxID=591449 RepID=A0AC34Q610_9BILA
MSFQIPANISGGLYFFDGKRQNVSVEKTFQVFEPHSGEVVAHCPIATEDIVDKVVKSAAKAQPGWGNIVPIERGKILNKVADLIRENLEAIAQWEVRTNGKPITEARIDIASSADTFQFFAGIAPAVMKGDYFDLPGDAHDRFAYTRREPLGVVGAIGAWNYPFQTCVWKVAPALAAGNAVVYKPSPFAPGSPVLLGEILIAAGLPINVYNVIQGEAETGTFLCEHELIRKVSFTGSVATGQKVQQSCARKNVKPVTLELGGKSPFIIFEDCEVKNAVAGAILANFLNQGQVCTNGTRVFVQRSILDEFTRILLQETEKLVVGDPFKDETNVGASINEIQLNKVLGMVEKAKSQGAKVLRGGQRLHPTGVENGFYFDPAIIADVVDDMDIIQNEIFGAVLCVLPFDTEDEVIYRANNTAYGLAAGLYTKCLRQAHRVAAQLQAGTIYINSYNDTEVYVPFGGYKNSGHGRENCIETLHSYSQVKAIYVNTQKNLEHHLG